MIVEWTERARTDYSELVDFIAKDSPTAADLVASRILAAVDSLATNPLKGHRAREGSGEGVYELVIARTRYTAAYRIKADVVEILALVHQSRRWPRPF
jgi:toxin ParE1/3/4